MHNTAIGFQLSLFVVVCAGACSNDHDKVDLSKIHIGINYLSNGNYQALHWNNGKSVPLDNVQERTKISSIHADEKHIYVAGLCLENTCLWIDEKRTLAIDFQMSDNPLAMHVSDGKVFLAGYQPSTGFAAYWHNDKVVTLPIEGIAHTIRVIREQVHVYVQKQAGSGYDAAYYIDGQLQDLSGIQKSRVVWNMDFADGHILLCGLLDAQALEGEYCTDNKGFYKEFSEYEGVAIAKIIDEKIYLGGTTQDGAALWVNGKKHQIATSSSGIVYDMDVHDGTLVAVGYYPYRSDLDRAWLWQEGTTEIIVEDWSVSADAVAIAP